MQECLVHSRYTLFEAYLPDLACDKKVHVTTETQNFSPYYVDMDIVAKK